MHIASKVRRVLSSRVDVEAVYLFGSHATGEAKDGSDVDLGFILAESASSSTLTSIRRDLETELEREVDVVDVLRAPADLVHRVFRDGQVLIDRNPRRRIRIEVQRRAEFIDLKFILDRYRDRVTR